MYKNLLKVAAFGLATLSLLPLLSVNTNAATLSSTGQELKTVNARSGLNLRDQKCVKIGVEKFGTIVEIEKTLQSITCNINNVNVKMVPVAIGSSKPGETSRSGYMAESWLSDYSENVVSTSTGTVLLNANINKGDQNVTYKVNTRSGLWLRNPETLKLTNKVPFGTVIKPASTCMTGLGPETPIIVNVRGKSYQMERVCYNGTPVRTASYFLK